MSKVKNVRRRQVRQAITRLDRLSQAGSYGHYAFTPSLVAWMMYGHSGVQWRKRYTQNRLAEKKRRRVGRTDAELGLDILND